MAIPKWFVNTNRVVNPAGGQFLCELNPPFLQHQTIELLVHIPTAGIELRHSSASGETKIIMMCVNNDTMYMTVEPGDVLRAYFYAGLQSDVAQCSLYAW